MFLDDCRGEIVHYAQLSLFVTGECYPAMHIVHKTSSSCVQQIVLLKEGLFVALKGRQNFSIKSAITCMLQRFMHPWMERFCYVGDCHAVN